MRYASYLYIIYYEIVLFLVNVKSSTEYEMFQLYKIGL